VRVKLRLLLVLSSSGAFGASDGTTVFLLAHRVPSAIDLR
jgi:hypothetical protein